MSNAIKDMFVELDEDGNPIDDKPKKKTTKAKSKEVKEESLLHDSGHNIVEFLSNGRFGYPNTFEYRDMLVKDEEILATAKTSTYSRTLNSVLKSVMNNPDWYEDMLISDRDYALMWIWAQNYGATKTLSVTCSNEECGKTNVHNVNLTQLPTTPLNEKIRYPFEMDLKCGHTVTIHPPTVKDELFAEEWLNKNPADRYDTVMSARVIRLEREPLFASKLEWMRNNVTGPELGKIKRYQEHSWFGVNPVIKHVCSSCKEETHGEIPFSASDILWPTVHADLEEFL